MVTDEIRLLQKITWDFSRRFPGWEYDELFSEAAYAYLSSRHRYRPEKGALSTFIYVVVSNHLKTILGRRARLVRGEVPLAYACNLASPPTWEEKLASLSPEAQHLCRLIVEERFPRGNRRTLRRRIQQALLDEGWTQQKVEQIFKEVQEAFA